MSTPQPPPPLFMWQVDRHGPAQVGVCGVSDDQGVACWHVYEELLSAPPGTRAVVHKVALQMSRGEYEYLGQTSVAWHDPETGAITWAGAPDWVGDWAGTTLAQARSVIRATSPGQFAAWWAAFRSRGTS